MYCDEFDVIAMGKDSIFPYFDLGCSIFYEDFNLSNLTLDSVSIEQASIDYIEYSITPSDGFESAVIPNKSYVSHWIPLEFKNGTYKPYLNLNKEFKYTGKPTLTENYIVELISKHDKKYSSNMFSFKNKYNPRYCILNVFLIQRFFNMLNM